MNNAEPKNQSTFGELFFYAVQTTLAYFWYVEDNTPAEYMFFGYIYILTFIYIAFISVLLTHKSELEKSIIDQIKSQKSAKFYFVFFLNTVWATLLIDKGNVVTAAVFYLSYIFCAITTAKMKEKATQVSLANKEKS